VFYTHSHRESVDAVIRGIANAAEVDSYVWDTMLRDHPEWGLRTRIVARSHEFGAPPVVANQQSVTKEEFVEMQSVLIDMARNPEGMRLLKRMNFDSFVPGDTNLYEGLVQMRRELGGK